MQGGMRNRARVRKEMDHPIKNSAYKLELRAIGIFGSKYDAAMWMAEPNPRFGWSSPRQMLKTADGVKQVEAALDDIADDPTQRLTG